MGGRQNDASPHIDRWSKAKLLRELTKTANMETCRCHLPTGYVGKGFPDTNGEDQAAISEATRLYRETWVNPLIEEIGKRLGL